MLLWPLIALGVLVLLFFMKRINYIVKMQFLLLLLLGLTFLAWDTALHPPFSSLKKHLALHILIIVKVFQWGISLSYLKPIYLISTSYVLGMALTCLSYRRYVIQVFIIALLVLLFLTALPIFSGQVFGQYYDNNVKGFHIPDDYKTIMNLGSYFYEHILLQPTPPLSEFTK